MLAVSQNSYYENCLVWTTITLDGWQNEMRQTYQTQFFQCAGQASCMFQLCFPY
jgi:hypothetical protein